MFDEYICPNCNGDGKETCHNPDHGFINFVGGELARLGCPCCGHDEDHKTGGEYCETCFKIDKSDGLVSLKESEEFIKDMEYDLEPEFAVKHGLFEKRSFRIIGQRIKKVLKFK